MDIARDTTEKGRVKCAEHTQGTMRNLAWQKNVGDCLMRAPRRGSRRKAGCLAHCGGCCEAALAPGWGVEESLPLERGIAEQTCIENRHCVLKLRKRKACGGYVRPIRLAEQKKADEPDPSWSTRCSGRTGVSRAEWEASLTACRSVQHRKRTAFSPSYSVSTIPPWRRKERLPSFPEPNGPARWESDEARRAG